MVPVAIVDGLVGHKPHHSVAVLGLSQEEIAHIAKELKKDYPDLSVAVLKRIIHHVLSAEASPHGGVMLGGVLIGGGSFFDALISGVRKFNQIAPSLVSAASTALKGVKQVHGDVSDVISTIKGSGEGGFSFGDFASLVKKGVSTAKQVGDATGLTDMAKDAAKKKAISLAAKHSSKLPAGVSSFLADKLQTI